MKFSEQTWRKIDVPAGKAEVVVFDEGVKGFGIRKFSDGRAVYFVRYLAGDARRKMVIGDCKTTKLTKARDNASEIVTDAKRGKDPLAEKAEKAKAQKASKENGLGKLVEQYLTQREGELRPRYRVEVERHLRRDWAPLHDRDVRSITRADLVRVVDALAKSNGKRSADAAKTTLSAFFGWCVERQFVDSSPVAGIARRSQNGSRERVLSPAELAAIWRASGDDDYGRIIKLLLLTGQRREEIGGLLWSEVNLEARQITLPGERTKNGREHVVPLSDAAVAILASIPRRGRALVFGRGEGGYSGWSRSKERLDERLGDAVGAWRLHDLRRSLATHSAEHDLAEPHHIEALLNHVSGSKGGIAGIYNRSTHERGKRQLADRWADFVASLVEGKASNVISLAKASK
jgi:integrase